MFCQILLLSKLVKTSLEFVDFRTDFYRNFIGNRSPRKCGEEKRKEKKWNGARKSSRVTFRKKYIQGKIESGLRTGGERDDTSCGSGHNQFRQNFTNEFNEIVFFLFSGIYQIIHKNECFQMLNTLGKSRKCLTRISFEIYLSSSFSFF